MTREELQTAFEKRTLLVWRWGQGKRREEDIVRITEVILPDHLPRCDCKVLSLANNGVYEITRTRLRVATAQDLLLL